MYQLGSALEKDPVFLESLKHQELAVRPAEANSRGMDADIRDWSRLQGPVIVGVSALKATDMLRLQRLWLVKVWAGEARMRGVV